ncbi:MAG: hypothetical protein ABIA77_01725 [Candidatus Omnitrophota bacterium]
MDIKNLEKLPEGVRDRLGWFAGELSGAFGEDIVSVFVYGSAAGAGYDPKHSDINVAVVMKDVAVGKLKPALKIIRAGLKKRITVPLFLTEKYIKDSLDTFPMEFMSMKDTRLVLLGEDVLRDIEAKRDDLRRECEFQLKGKILTIRQAYLEQALTRKGLERLIKSAFRALMPLFRNILRLKTGAVPPEGKKEMIESLGRELGVDVSSFLEVLRDRKMDGRVGGKDPGIFIADFIVQLERLSESVDRL